MDSEKEKANLISQTGLYLWRQRPEFILSEAEGVPHTRHPLLPRPLGTFVILSSRIR